MQTQSSQRVGAASICIYSTVPTVQYLMDCVTGPLIGLPRSRFALLQAQTQYASLLSQCTVTAYVRPTTHHHRRHPTFPNDGWDGMGCVRAPTSQLATWECVRSEPLSSLVGTGLASDLLGGKVGVGRPQPAEEGMKDALQFLSFPSLPCFRSSKFSSLDTASSEREIRMQHLCLQKCGLRGKSKSRLQYSYKSYGCAMPYWKRGEGGARRSAKGPFPRIRKKPARPCRFLRLRLRPVPGTF